MKIMEKCVKAAAPLTCPIVRSAHLIGDEWVLLVLRSLFRGSQRFDDLQKQTGAATNILTNRLTRLIEAKVVAKTPYQERPLRYKYELTDVGKGLFPVVLELMRFGNEWLPREDCAPMVLLHTECGKLTKPGQTCSECGGPLVLGKVRLLEPDAEANPEGKQD
jgi:DNA-binding HxlR family transcriptional regulator